MVAFNWTVDFESDFGGRENSIRGIEVGAPKILEAFEKHNVKAIFFLSTKKLVHYLPIAREIIGAGHTIGSHGHEHLDWRKDQWQNWTEDFEISRKMLKEYLDVSVDWSLYRAPWFSKNNYMVYDRKLNHVSVLKYTWVGGFIPKNPIFYLHPFDIVKPMKPAPSMFCRVLYSQPEKVLETFHELLQKFS